MSAPFIFIATNRLREGKLAAERDRAADLGSFIEKNEPQLLAFNEYVNEDGTEVGVVQIHADAACLSRLGLEHMRVARQSDLPAFRRRFGNFRNGRAVWRDECRTTTRN